MRDVGILLMGVAALFFVVVDSYVSIQHMNIALEQWNLVP